MMIFNQFYFEILITLSKLTKHFKHEENYSFTISIVYI